MLYIDFAMIRDLTAYSKINIKLNKVHEYQVKGGKTIFNCWNQPYSMKNAILALTLFRKRGAK